MAGSAEQMSNDEEPDLREAIGLGVAGNFAGHLEQAGEAADFAALAPRSAGAPKGIFPFYVPAAGASGGDHFLHTYPISSTRLRLAAGDEKHQIEPEVALLCDLVYANGRVCGIAPRAAMAHDDCSIRRPGAKKISEKKNWGPHSKGTAPRAIAIDRFAPGGVLDHFRLASFLVRKGEAHEYGVDSALTSYSYFYEELLAWLVDRMSAQVDEGPLEDIPKWIERAGSPRRALISIGATRYAEFGEHTFLERGDRAVVALYDARVFDRDAVLALVARPGAPVPADGISLLDQRVE